MSLSRDLELSFDTGLPSDRLKKFRPAQIELRYHLGHVGFLQINPDEPAPGRSTTDSLCSPVLVNSISLFLAPSLVVGLWRVGFIELRK